MALIALRIKAEILNIVPLFTLILHSFHSLCSACMVLFSVFWMSLFCATGPLLMLIHLLDPFLLLSPPSHLSNISSGKTHRNSLIHISPSTILSFYCHHNFYFTFVYDSVINICFPLMAWAPSGKDFGFCSLLFVSSAWDVICSQRINEWTDQAMQHKSGGWCICELVWQFQLGSTATCKLQLKNGPCVPEKVICLLDPDWVVRTWSHQGGGDWLPWQPGQPSVALSTRESIFDLLSCFWRPTIHCW